MFGKLGVFLGESKQELAKVNWPTRNEWVSSTILVLVVTFIVGLYIFGVDLVLSFLMKLVLR